MPKSSGLKTACSMKLLNFMKIKHPSGYRTSPKDKYHDKFIDNNDDLTLPGLLLMIGLL